MAQPANLDGGKLDPFSASRMLDMARCWRSGHRSSMTSLVVEIVFCAHDEAEQHGSELLGAEGGCCVLSRARMRLMDGLVGQDEA